MGKLLWKDEDEVNGVACGPVWLEDDDGNREELKWMTKPEAMQTAMFNGDTFEEV